MAKATKNPIYVVTNNGKDVEIVASIAQMIIVKLHLRPVLDVLISIIKGLLESVKSSVQLEIVSNLLEKIIGLLGNFKFAV